MHDSGWYLADPRMSTAGALVPCLPVAMHDRLENGGKGRNSNTGTDEHGVLRAEYVRGGRAVRTVEIDLEQTETGG
ncbi:hypothetical protein M8J76_016828 [Diaphorina citri]|nr:hypothetical protein M8J76_016828 [Diaphorina citri]